MIPLRPTAAACLLALALGVTGSTLAASDPYLASMCASMNRWTAKDLQEFPDPQVERATCLCAKATLRAGTTGDREAEGNCMAAMRKLVEEFKRRWPNREPSEVTGKC